MFHLLEDIARAKAYTEHPVIKYSILALMSCLCIFFGSSGSISKVQENKEKHQEAALKSPKDAVKLFLQMICCCLIIYIFPELLSNVYIITFIKLSFTIEGVIHLMTYLRPLVSKLIPENPQVNFYGIINIHATSNDIITFAICSRIGFIYFWNNHWFLNNIFAITSAIARIKSTHINKITIALTFLGLVVIGPIVVFVFVSYAIPNYFKEPILLVFPKYRLHEWENEREFSKLTLVDVTFFPGLCIAFFLRFDKSLNRDEKLYFNSGLVGYIIGFVAMVAMEFYFEHKQPEMLYLVPICISIPSVVAFIKGDIEALLNYHDY